MNIYCKDVKNKTFLDLVKTGFLNEVHQKRGTY